MKTTRGGVLTEGRGRRCGVSFKSDVLPLRGTVLFFSKSCPFPGTPGEGLCRRRRPAAHRGRSAVFARPSAHELPPAFSSCSAQSLPTGLFQGSPGPRRRSVVAGRLSSRTVRRPPADAFGASCVRAFVILRRTPGLSASFTRPSSSFPAPPPSGSRSMGGLRRRYESWFALINLQLRCGLDVRCALVRFSGSGARLGAAKVAPVRRRRGPATPGPRRRRPVTPFAAPRRAGGRLPVPVGVVVGRPLWGTGRRRRRRVPPPPSHLAGRPARPGSVVAAAVVVGPATPGPPPPPSPPPGPGSLRPSAPGGRRRTPPPRPMARGSVAGRLRRRRPTGSGCARPPRPRRTATGRGRALGPLTGRAPASPPPIGGDPRTPLA